MNLQWDYSDLAASYNNRPNYSQQAIDEIFSRTQLKKDDLACDVGAGTGYLTKMIADKGLRVTAIEPNENMRSIGIAKTQGISKINWVEATAEKTLQENHMYDLVSFGSSFNVVNSDLALSEVKRIGKPGSWILMIWNHRDLNSVLQNQIELVIKCELPDYDYGKRRQDQYPLLKNSNLFKTIECIERNQLIKQNKETILKAWLSHATLKRQAGEKYKTIIDKIAQLIDAEQSTSITIPYVSRAWIAQLK